MAGFMVEVKSVRRGEAAAEQAYVWIAQAGPQERIGGCQIRRRDQDEDPQKVTGRPVKKII